MWHKAFYPRMSEIETALKPVPVVDILTVCLRPLIEIEIEPAMLPVNDRFRLLPVTLPETSPIALNVRSSHWPVMRRALS
jgi:hypothetical protein